MSSTSSSDCETCDCCQCGCSLDDTYNNYNSNYGRTVASNRHVPFYTAMEHPLIYYAEVERPLNRRQQPRKENQNCFVKAFKWYTQKCVVIFEELIQGMLSNNFYYGTKPENTKKITADPYFLSRDIDDLERVPAKNIDIFPEKSGFANWLDVKYIEYLRESRQNQNFYQLRAQETTTIEPCAPSSSPYEPCTNKIFARVRSPWRKRRHPCKDSGDVPEKCPNQSCEFILQPKDLTRAASDCCYPTPTSGCIDKSNATVVSSNVPGTMRCSGRSRSLSSVCRERSVPKHIDTIPCTEQDGSKTQPPLKSPPIPHCREQIQQVPSKSQKVDVSCQCPEEKVIPVNAETQYEPMRHVSSSNTEARAPCICNVGEGYTPMPVQIYNRKLSSPEVKPKRLPSTQSYKPKKQKRIKRSNISCQCPEENIVRVDTQSQYQTVPEPVCECRYIAPNREMQEINQLYGPKSIRRQSFTTVTVNDTEICECVVSVKEVAAISKVTRSLTCIANDAVQTSDHSICLDRGGAHPYPLFMKIVCADRLNNE